MDVFLNHAEHYCNSVMHTRNLPLAMSAHTKDIRMETLCHNSKRN